MVDNLLDLLGIGLLGGVQNLLAAGAMRHPGALGVHLTPVETIRAPRVRDVVQTLEEKYPSVGVSLLDVFFPGGLRVKDKDIEFWREAKQARLTPNNFGTLI